MKRITFENIQHVAERGFDFCLKTAYKLSIPFKVKAMRRKDVIDVLFILTELSVWKTEELYLAMLQHPRFNPILGVSLSLENPEALSQLCSYLNEKKYTYINLDSNDLYIDRDIHPDIIFYQKPYDGVYRYHLTFSRHLNSLFCYVNYAFYTVKERWLINNSLSNYCWQLYFPNVITLNDLRPLSDMKCKNVLATGMPMQDVLLKPKEAFTNPWKCCGNKKKIIYAPHHTIGNEHMSGINYSTFLTYCDFVLELAEKYKDVVQFAFKPHPVLYNKLVRLWGQVRTDEYYSKWQSLENTQLATGDYVGLFKYSNAMIHDSSSFIIEYHYTNNPTMFLDKGEEDYSNMTTFARKAIDLHYKGRSKDDVEKFILDVISGKDPLMEERKQFLNDYLLPPSGKTASQNILDAILYK